MEVTLSEESLKKLGEMIADKILFAKNRPEPYVSIDEITQRTGRKKETLYKDVQKGLPCIRGGRRLKFKFSDVETWLRNR